MLAQNLLSAGLVFTVAFLTYYNSLFGGFVFDDHRAILTNGDLDAGKTSFWRLFINDFWGGHMSRIESHKSYRPLTVLTFRYLNFWFAGLEPFSYHLVNVLLHCVASVLFLLISRRVLGGRERWPLYAAILFAVHSVHTEAIASVVGRAEVLACVFFLLSLLYYMKGVCAYNGRLQAPIVKTKWKYIVLSVFMSACSLLSKEQGITAVGVCAVFDLFLNWNSLWQAVTRTKNNEKAKKVEENAAGFHSDPRKFQGQRGTTHAANGFHTQTASSSTDLHAHETSGKQHNMKSKHYWTDVQNMMLRLGLLVVSGVLLVWLRMSMNYGSDPIFKPNEMRAAFHPDRFIRMMSFSNIYTHNAWLLLSSMHLCCDWTLGSVPLVTSPTDPRNIYSLLLYASLAVLLLHLLFSKSSHMAIGMALALLLMPFLPASGILVQVGFVIAERILYMPSMGFCLLVTYGARRLAQSCPRRITALLNAAMAYLVLILAAKSIARNEDWKTDMALFTSGVKINPANVKLRNNLGMELKSAGRLEEAQHQYKMAMQVEPEYGEVYFNYGNLLSDAGQYESAAVYFDKSLQISGTQAKTLNNLATMYYRLGRWSEAEQRYKESLDISKDQANTYNNLASLYGETKRFKESEKMFKKALELSPTYTEAYFNLGTLYIQMGAYEQAEVNLKHALELNPEHYGAINNLKVLEYQRARLSIS